VCACVQGAGDRRDVRSRRDELTTAARNEAHKLQRVQEARAALHALPDTGAFVCVSVCVCVCLRVCGGRTVMRECVCLHVRVGVAAVYEE
jgi:hypothetical protein